MAQLIISLAILLFQIAVLFLGGYIIWSSIVSKRHGAPYIPMWWGTVKPILSFGAPDANDVFYDLGCGDGRILMAAAKKFSVKHCVGYDIASWPRLKAKMLSKIYGTNGTVEIKKGNILEADISNASFIYMYLLPGITDKMAGKIQKECKPGTKVLCPAFPIDCTKYPQFVLKKEGKVGRMDIYLYQKV